MQRSTSHGHLLPEHSAPQHERAPRPLPLFLDMVRMLSEEDPETARLALAGLGAYERAERPAARADAPETARQGPAALRGLGGSGPPVVLVPSLINPPNILDLDEETSLAGAVAGMDRRVLLVEWGKADQRAGLDVGGHVEEFLVPLLQALDEPAAVIGYCLGGTMALAAANLARVECVGTLAAPWHFGRYPDASRASLQRIWKTTGEAARVLGALPMEVLQAAFWSLDPGRTVSKFAGFASYAPGSPEARRFVALEEWANQGEPLPYPAARQLMEDFFETDLPGRGEWMVGGRAMSDRPSVPVLNLTAGRDCIAPAATAPSGPAIQIDSGHVGMVVGSARTATHSALRDFLHPLAAPADGR